MEFRPRNYSAEQKSYSLRRIRVEDHPLSRPFSSPQLQVEDHANKEFLDPLRASNDGEEVATDPLRDVESTSTSVLSSEASVRNPTKEWTSYKRLLMQRFPVSKMVSISSMSDAIMKGGKILDKPSTNMHLEELEDPQKSAEEGTKVITRQEYVSRLHELKDEITQAWKTSDRVAALKLSIKVARLLMDTSVLQFYPTLFVLVTDIMDMVGDMVWERIKLKAEFAENGRKHHSLPDNFEASNICSDAKETCHNWFCKIGAIRELLPRIYLELAILPCWRFMNDRPEDCLQRMVMMARGLADPLASAYCRLYMVHCLWKVPSYDTGFLVRCVNDIKNLLSRILSSANNDNKRLLISLMEPTIEFMMQCIFRDVSQRPVGNILVELGVGRNEGELFGSIPCVSIVLHHLLKELPVGVVSFHAVAIFHLIECSKDYSFNQCLNYRLFGFRLCESKSQTDVITAVVDKLVQAVTQYDSFDDYLKVVDAFLDILLQNGMDNHLNSILEDISKHSCDKGINENELASLQSILVKLLSHYEGLEDVLALNHFLEILDVMYGSSRSLVTMHILSMATRKGHICDPAIIQLLFGISQALHDTSEFANVKDDDQAARLISRFVQMVDYGAEMERHLTFLVECRGAFGSISGLKESLIHSSNSLAIKALQSGNKHLSFVRSCIAFSEVTLPSISVLIRQMNLYLETAEVALFGGLLPHSEGLINSAVSCLLVSDFIDGSRTVIDVDGIHSSVRKLCSLLVIVPGNPEVGVTFFPKNILSLIDSQSWVKPKMRARIYCDVVSLVATLSQNKLPYHADNEKVLGNDHLFLGDLSYSQELFSLSTFVLQKLVDVIQQEPSMVARGNLALEACNCLALSFIQNEEISPICSKLIETAKSCLNPKDRYLQSTIRFLDKSMLSSNAVPSIAVQ